MSETLGLDRRKSTHEERLKRMIAEREERLPYIETSIETKRKDLEAASTGHIREFFTHRDPEAPVRQRLMDVLTEAIELGEQLATSKDKAGDIRRMVEVVIQRDREWADSLDGEIDPRMLFFREAEEIVAPKRFHDPYPSYGDLLEELRNKRNDPQQYERFIEQTVANISKILDEHKSLLVLVRNFDAGEKEAAEEAAHMRVGNQFEDMYRRDLARSENRLSTVRRHISKLKAMLEDVSKKS